MAPRGSRTQSAPSARGGKSSALSSKGSSRGGIQKRKGGPTKVDVDGDLDMDSTARKAQRGTGTTAGGSRRQQSTRSSTTSNPRGASKTAQTILKHLNNGDSSTIASRISTSSSMRATRSRGQDTGPLSYLRVHGLKQSKAAGNPDGGLSDLLAFLERKAAGLSPGSKRRVIIKKVCLSLRNSRRAIVLPDVGCQPMYETPYLGDGPTGRMHSVF
jgi:nuclear RNA export factor